MKKMKKVAAAIGVALSLGVVSQSADALIEFKADTRGDALLFPVYIGMQGFESYYAISNDANAWIQGHIRFRGAAWEGELLDFDVILSPGDVFVFRLADVDGDGMWEVDQTLDEKNFQYTGLLEVPDQGRLDPMLPTSNCSYTDSDGVTQWRHKCMDPSFELIPEAELLAAGVDQGKINHQKTIGYIEFIGESVFNGMDHTMMAILLGGVPGQWAPYQTDVFSARGTTAWKWSNAENQFATYPPTSNDAVWIGDRCLRDVGNWLSGVGFISMVNVGIGLGYNAEAFVNFRTDQTDHRIDNYRVDRNGNTLDISGVVTTGGVFGSTTTTTGGSNNPNCSGVVSPNKNRAVVVHDENGAGPAGKPGAITPYGDYLYRFSEGENTFESRVSFNNTWGPTLADGDDYDLTSCGHSSGIGNVYQTKEPTDPNNPATLTNVNLRRTLGTECDKFTATCGESDNQIDDWDVESTGASNLESNAFNEGVNSIAEVEEAIRVGGQYFSAYYFDEAAPGAKHRSSRSFKTWFFSFSPTKFFYGEGLRVNVFDRNHPEYATAPTTATAFQVRAIKELLELPKTFEADLWDINETSWCQGSTTVSGSACISPFTAEQCGSVTVIRDCYRVCAEGLCVFSIDYLKQIATGLKDTSQFRVGRAEMKTTNNNAVSVCNVAYHNRDDFPSILYNFEISGTDFVNWRTMHR
jgi:hypothetical protein